MQVLLLTIKITNKKNISVILKKYNNNYNSFCINSLLLHKRIRVKHKLLIIHFRKSKLSEIAFAFFL